MKAIFFFPLLFSLLLFPVSADSPTRQQAITVKAPIQSALNMTLLSANINGCSQVANVNSTWTGNGYYLISPSSFSLITRSRNSVYGNTTDVIIPNNTIDQWYLFKNVPITLSISFESCTSIGSENLVFSDGTFFFILH